VSLHCNSSTSTLLASKMTSSNWDCRFALIVASYFCNQGTGLKNVRSMHLSDSLCKHWYNHWHTCHYSTHVKDISVQDGTYVCAQPAGKLRPANSRRQMAGVCMCTDSSSFGGICQHLLFSTCVTRSCENRLI